jgi:hypothetical protein
VLIVSPVKNNVLYTTIVSKSRYSSIKMEILSKKLGENFPPFQISPKGRGKKSTRGIGTFGKTRTHPPLGVEVFGSFPPDFPLFAIVASDCQERTCGDLRKRLGKIWGKLLSCDHTK